jgi:hypothetical protein
MRLYDHRSLKNIQLRERSAYPSRITTPQCSSTSRSSRSKEKLFEDFVDFVLTTQTNILSSAEEIEGREHHFQQDRWDREAGNPDAGEACKSSCVLV